MSLPMPDVLPMVGGYVGTLGRVMLRVSVKRLIISFNRFTLLILGILPPTFLKEFRAHKIQVASASVLAVRGGGTHLVARVLVTAFSAGAVTICSISPAVFFMLDEADARTTFLALELGSIGVGVGARAGLVAKVVGTVVGVIVGVVAGIVFGVATGVGFGDELCNLVLELGKFRRHSCGRWRCSDGNFTDGVQGGGRSSGWVLIRGQVRHEGGEIFQVRVEFISKLVLEVFFEGGRIEDDVVGY